MQKTLRVRIKDKHAKYLRELAREVNFVFNYVNELGLKILERSGKFPSAYDLHKYTAGATKEGLRLHSQTVQAIADEYVRRRKQFKKRRLAWRKSSGAHRSLGWIPFKACAIAFRSGQLRYGKTWLSLWDSYGLSKYELGTGSFSEDSRGRWYANIVIEVKAPTAPVHPVQEILSGALPSVGIDLGLKEMVVDSNGISIEAKRFYRNLESKLAVAQRAKNKKRVSAIHAKVKNRRNDFLHKQSRILVNQNAAIFVGNVNASALVKTKMAKSVLDAGWSSFRTMLCYKSAHAGAWFEEVSEAYSTQTCSVCKNRTGPKGREDLGIREWTCTECGHSHHRDVNAARNILAAGHGRLAEGIPAP
jgi:IS605 OrfB family transposase